MSISNVWLLTLTTEASVIVSTLSVQVTHSVSTLGTRVRSWLLLPVTLPRTLDVSIRASDLEDPDASLSCIGPPWMKEKLIQLKPSGVPHGSITPWLMYEPLLKWVAQNSTRLKFLFMHYMWRSRSHLEWGFLPALAALPACSRLTSSAKSPNQGCGFNSCSLEWPLKDTMFWNSWPTSGRAGLLWWMSCQWAGCHTCNSFTFEKFFWQVEKKWIDAD